VHQGLTSAHETEIAKILGQIADMHANAHGNTLAQLRLDKRSAERNPSGFVLRLLRRLRCRYRPEAECRECRRGTGPRLALLPRSIGTVAWSFCPFPLFPVRAARIHPYTPCFTVAFMIA
jgi:hypothetical protein